MVGRLFFCYSEFDLYSLLLVGYLTERNNLGTQNTRISYIAIQTNCKICPMI